MIRSYKKVSSLFLILLSLLSNFALAMPSRLSRRAAGTSRALGNGIARNSLAGRLQPRAVRLNSLLGVRGGRLAVNPLASVSPSLSQRASVNDFAAEQRDAARDRIFRARIPQEQAQARNAQNSESQAQTSRANEPRKSALEIVRERVAQQDPQIIKPAKAKAAASARKKNKSALDIARARIKQNQSAMQNASINIPRELTPQISMGSAAQEVSRQEPMDLISMPTPMEAKQAIEGADLATALPESPQAIKARIVYNNAMQALNRVLNGLEQLQQLQHNAPNYAQLHNQMRQALIAAQQQGYSVGFIDKKLVERIGALPGSQAQLLQNQPDASGVIIPAQSLGFMGVVQTPKFAQVLGLQGDFVPFIYKMPKNALPVASNLFDPAIEIVRASMGDNPFQADRLKIIIQPMEQQLMPPAQAQNADMRLADLSNGDNNNKWLQGNDANQNQKLSLNPDMMKHESRNSAPQPVDIDGASCDNGARNRNSIGEQEVNRNNASKASAIQEPLEIGPKEPSNGNGGNNNNNGLQGNGTHQNQRPPFDPNAPSYESRHAAPQPLVNFMRNLGGASLDDGGQPQNDRPGENEVDRDNISRIPFIAEPEEIEPKMPSHNTPHEPRFARQLPSHEESAINQYASLILQALRARTYLRLEWAGLSQTLRIMFIDYNALLSQYRKINDQFSNTLYTDSNQRIYQVVNIVWNSFHSAKN